MNPEAIRQAAESVRKFIAAWQESERKYPFPHVDKDAR